MIEETFTRGNVGIISRSGTTPYEAAAMLAEKGIGQSTRAGTDGDPIPEGTWTEVLELFEGDA
jgi:succinyl-CoA synthetase alpha subunit